MKIFATICLIIFLHTSVKAGCGGVCIGLNPTASYNIDTAYLDQNSGSISLYANYNSCCAGYISANMELIWLRDGVPFDTTDLTDAYELTVGMYTTLINVHTAGLYEVRFINFQGENYGCGKVQVFKTEELHSASSQHPINSVSNEGNNFELLLYPNPSWGGNIYISYTNDLKIYQIELYDITGIMVLSYIPNTSGLIELFTENFKKGMYITRIYTSKGNLNRKILIK